MRGDPRVTLAALAVVVGLASSLPVDAEAQPAPYPVIPAPRYEAVPPPPGSRYLWEPGHWRWDGRAYVWDGGHYILRRPRYAQFIPGHWALRPIGWIWVPAHWR